MFPRIYTDPPIQCPLDGYAGYSFRVLLNPTRDEITDWQAGGLGLENCADCAKLGTARGKQASGGKKYCERCQTMRDRMGKSATAIYGTSRVEGLDFSTHEAALATFDLADLPDELRYWLYTLPDALWIARRETVKKKLQLFSAIGDSTPN